MSSVATVAPPPVIASYKVLGVRVDAVQIPDAIAEIERWIAERGPSRYISVTGMHGVTEALADPNLRAILNSSALVVPDGTPLVWLARFHGLPLRRRVYGPELMETFCRETGSRYRHFFYGSAPGVPEQLAASLHERYGVHSVGAYSPPFRPLTGEEERALLAQIEAAAPDVLWVGLSTPKQERWMHNYRDKVRVPVMLGVGAAFDLNSGNLQQAPVWMRENGLEWLFRLLAEPRRLWRRYILGGSKFVWNASLEILKIKQFN
jgi:N-acetylglucosaminyldiphosphoundecaprenol N-acetyl-beta-D-mannosaminyltransferase